jgi:hypothetical protein
MGTNAQAGMAHLDNAQRMATEGDFLTARDYWSDACAALAAAKKAGEHKVAREYAQALQQASKFLDEHGQAMADAFAEEEKREAAQAELLRLRALVAAIKRDGEKE